MGTARAAVARPKLIPDGILGMLVFIFTEIMLFAGLVSAHTIVRSGAQAGQMWPPYGQPRLPAAETAFNTAALLASGIALLLGQVAFRRRWGVAGGTVPAQTDGSSVTGGDATGFAWAKLLLPVAALLGAFFVVSQGREWTALVAEGLTLTSSTYGAFFYLIVGTHGLHAVAAILALGWVCHRLWKDRLTAPQLGTVAVFWYFVVLVWPLLYWRVYL